jgi:hypothetical protein
LTELLGQFTRHPDIYLIGVNLLQNPFNKLRGFILKILTMKSDSYHALFIYLQTLYIQVFHKHVIAIFFTGIFACFLIASDHPVTKSFQRSHDSIEIVLIDF